MKKALSLSNSQTYVSPLREGRRFELAITAAERLAARDGLQRRALAGSPAPQPCGAHCFDR